MNTVPDMLDPRTEFLRLYQEALRKYLHQSPTAGMESAWELGHHAISLGLETLDMARIHEIALVTLVLPHESSSSRTSLLGRAGLFFAEVITPIEQTHRSAREANTHLNHIIMTLNRRTSALADSVAELQQEIVKRKVLEESLRASERTSIGLLEKSQLMQEELRNLSDESRSLSRQLLSIQEEERRRISRELHDVIAQTLTGINMRLGALKAESHTNMAHLQEKITSTQQLVEESLDIVHRFASELRPTVLDDLGLIPALKSFMQSFMTDTGVRASLKTYAGIEQASGTVRTVLYRIAQEALTNVARHAMASQVEVYIQCLGGGIRMEITDNGRGFEVDGMACANKKNRLGLLGMRERVEMVGGTFGVKSAPGHATIVRVEIPFETDPPPSALPESLDNIHPESP